MMTRARAGIAVIAACVGAAGCDRRRPLASCEDDLRGVYEAPSGRWMLLDRRTSLEAYPLFPDVPAAPGLEVAPRVLQLSRSGAAITGAARRRYMRGARVCVARAPVRITACRGEGIELVLSDPSPPIAWPAVAPAAGSGAGSSAELPCEWPRPGDSRLERWRRE